jgi:probable HAF family extracellular repeat protein
MLRGPNVVMKFCSLLSTAILLSSVVSAQVAPHSCAASHYKIVALPFQPVHINNSGMIAGTTARADEDHKPAIWTEKDGLRVIELPEGFIAAEPHGISRSGEIVGTASREGSQQSFAFKYVDGKFTLLPEDHAKAMAVSSSGEIAGQAAEHLVLWKKDKATQLGGCCGGMAHAMNDHGQIVGQFNDKDGHYAAFLWDAGHGLQSIAPPKAANSVALAINDTGHVLLQSFTPNAVYLWRAGKLTSVPLSPEFASQPLGLNSCDVVVGEFGPASDFNHAFIWDQAHGFRDLNKLADTGAQWTLESAFDINNRGEIIGIGDRGSEQDVGFLLIPDRESVNHEGHEGTRR